MLCADVFYPVDVFKYCSKEACIFWFEVIKYRQTDDSHFVVDETQQRPAEVLSAAAVILTIRVPCTKTVGQLSLPETWFCVVQYIREFFSDNWLSIANYKGKYIRRTERAADQVKLQFN